MTARRFDAMVIGGGLVGSAIAWGLRREGLSVVLLDEGDAAYRASRGNFGLVWVQSKGLGAPWYQRWTRQSAESWAELADDLAKQTGQSLGLSQPGGLHLCLSDKEMKERAERLEQMKREAGNYGFEYRMLDAREAREMLPGLGPAVVGASFTPYDGHVSPLALLRSLHHGFTALGGVYLPNVKITGIATAPRNFLLETNLGTIQAERAVLAAGLGNATLASHFGLKAPVRPQRGQVLVTERTRAALPMPTTTIRQTGEGSIMLGDSVEEVGFDTRQTQPVMAEIAHRAALCFPWIGKLNVVRAWSALRVMSPDGLPIYDQSETLPGAFTANCHSGVTLAAAHGKLLAPMIARGALDPFLAPFSAERF
ncbi:MAG: NAD(P)/FAD-dependent oxidoreductase [Alphaproteobacteria bacterium]|jgi:hydrogen cyanide synthase HcnC|nr:FAD-binding oxidoreductase [Roseomonas sp.]